METYAKYGGGMTDSFIHPLVVVLLVIAVLLICILPYRKIILVVLCFTILIPIGQQFYIAGVHLFVNRIIILVGLIRAIYSQEQPFTGRWNRLDQFFSLYVLIEAVAFSLQYRELGAVINQFGFIWDTLGGYLLLRMLIVDHEDIERALICIGNILVLLAISMLIEQIYLVNLFGNIGGHLTPEMRGNSLRSCGSFQHSLTAGAVGAITFPLYLLLWYKYRRRVATALAMIAATIMTITAHSSGPLLAYLAGIIALLFWPLRRQMRLIRRVTVFSLLGLHLVMKAPIWFLIGRIDLTGSSSSYHRAALIDKFINKFNEWWLIGTPNHGKWGYDLWDVQNQYVSVGIEGGIGALICFIAIIIAGFSMIGNAYKVSINQLQERCLWVIGAALFSSLIVFLGVNLFDQSRMLWFMLLAILSVATANLHPSKQLSIVAN